MSFAEANVLCKIVSRSARNFSGVSLPCSSKVSTTKLEAGIAFIPIVLACIQPKHWLCPATSSASPTAVFIRAWQQASVKHAEVQICQATVQCVADSCMRICQMGCNSPIEHLQLSKSVTENASPSDPM